MCNHIYICHTPEDNPVKALCGCVGTGTMCIEQSFVGSDEAFSRCGVDPTVVKCWKCRK
jgi:hypothetical protein